MSRRWLVLLVAVPLAAVAVATDGEPVPTRVVDLLAGASFLVLAVLALPRYRRYAVLAALAGVAWFAAGLVAGALWVHRPLMLWCAMAHPDGRLARALPRVALGLAAVAALVPAGARSPGASLLLGLVEAAAAWQLRTGAPLGRRASARTASAATWLLAASLALPAALRLFWPQLVSRDLLVDAYCGLVAVAGLTLAVGTAAGPADRETDTVIELTEADDPQVALERLRAARDGADPAAARPISGAVSLLEANVTLRADLAAEVDDVRASRRRLVEATLTEHQRLERRLGAGAMRLLDDVAGALRTLEETGDELTARCVDEVERMREDLRQLARGLHPRALTDGGLAVALAELAERSSLPVALTVPEQRFPPITEATVWYACAEALTNAAKHSGARAAAVEVRVDGQDLVAEVRDDGRGGAHAAPRGGLAGLADRLSAVDGRLTVDSPPGRGTRVRIEVPL